jgi:hypothetical protein
MRWCILGSFLPTMALGQWQPLYPSAPWPQQGTPTGKQVLMTADAKGFLLHSVYYSPSSGSGYFIYHTENDWDENPADHVASSGGGIGCCYASFLDITPAGAVVYQRFDSGISQFRKVSYEAGVASTQTVSLPPTSIFEVCAVNDSLFFALRNNLDGSVDIIKSDGDDHEQLATVLDSGVMRGLDFFDAQRGCLVTNWSSGASRIRTTTDGGLTWSLSYATGSRLNEVLWPEPENLWAVGDNGLVLHSSDSGQGWSVITPPTPIDLHCAASCSSDSLWVAGEGGTVLNTGDGGLTWQDHPVGDTTINMIQAFPGVVYAYSAHGSVFRYGVFESVGDDPAIVPQPWWTAGEQGLTLFPCEDERLLWFGLSDAQGRPVGARVNGWTVDLSGIPAGLYFITLSTNKRTETGKVLWLSQDH